MDNLLFKKLYADGLISGASFEKVQTSPRKNLSIHMELITILYLGVLLLAGGMGILIYKNIDSIGHTVILIFIAAISAGSFFYCFKNSSSFSLKKVISPNLFFDYILLLGCITFIIFIGYLQFQYEIFGDRFGLALFIPMVLLFAAAYYFDNIAILSLATTNLGAWAGIAITPAKILRSNNFDNNINIVTGLCLGVLLIATGIVVKKKNLKAHFEFTYANFGAHLLFISCIAAMMHFDSTYFFWFLLLAGVSYFFIKRHLSVSLFIFC